MAKRLNKSVRNIIEQSQTRNRQDKPKSAGIKTSNDPMLKSQWKKINDELKQTKLELAKVKAELARAQDELARLKGTR